jgi:hypothetical protein
MKRARNWKPSVLNRTRKVQRLQMNNISRVLLLPVLGVGANLLTREGEEHHDDNLVIQMNNSSGVLLLPVLGAGANLLTREGEEQHDNNLVMAMELLEQEASREGEKYPGRDPVARVPTTQLPGESIRRLTRKIRTLLKS